MNQVICKHCKKIFKQNKNLYEHIRNVHKANVTTGSLKCPMNDCEVCLKTRMLLRDHLSNFHNLKHVEEKEEHQFDSFTSFLQWKEAIEAQLKSSYCSSASVTLANGSKKRYFLCNRSGIFISKASGSRASKSQGTCRSGNFCPSTIEVIENDKIYVTFYKAHVGHENELKYLPLNLRTSVKSELAIKISDAISLKQCSNDVRNSLPDNFERINLLTKQDQQNIGNTKVYIANSHIVKKEKNECDCELFFNTCKICIHCYSCTCSDFTVRANLCKHIHAVGIYFKNAQKPLQERESVVINEFMESASFISPVNLDNLNNDDDNSQLKSKLSHALRLLDNVTLNDETKKLLNKHLDAIISLIENDDEKVDTTVSYEPVNKKIKL